jgi:hypothetical protein
VQSSTQLRKGTAKDCEQQHTTKNNISERLIKKHTIEEKDRVGKHKLRRKTAILQRLKKHKTKRRRL